MSNAIIAKAIDRLRTLGCKDELFYSSASYYDVAAQICKLAAPGMSKYLRSKKRQKNFVLRFIAGGVPLKKAKDSFYATRKWKDVRYEVLQKHGARCQCCGASASNGARIHVDHIKPRSTHPELELSPENLQVLCEACNQGKSNRDATDWRPKLIVVK